ncbi:major Facilitator Superfamily protein [Chlamydia psittaci 02DC14]|nr:major Facilitator Superfamily protein [Chlamydia psittaci 02DC18]EPJ17313.1 major Facilitator Superfamily protein [Chlamydia psittaci 02DC22]EPJ20793.1 major Facilitator Superfamily protein [Chlamydia psittaci 02DC21]EPJ23288.1 major Facilitator Superfamily protein [Chlamydia psittaci 08DC60]EPJ24767.1 major Facilitator Superfamily protein [Chlamydia psittaci 03DC29]EPJ27785.1 major Facilitator Superfamily protein [Chlamydia psittaci C19/98]EPJ98379.1 major Facilitator Superfamily protein 
MCFALPFLLLAPLAGSLSDRYQKRNIILATRLIEIVCTSLGLYFFYIHSVVGGYVVLILMASHTAIFGPAKMGILPEMLPLDYLSRANGIMTAVTYTGSILGSCFAPLLVDLTKNLPINCYVLSTSFCVVSSIVSTFVSLGIRSSNFKNRSQKITYASFKDLWEIFKDTRHVHYLTLSIFLVALFLLVGAYVQVEIIPFVEFTLGYPKHYGGYLFPIVALGVGVGSYITGWISGKDIKLGYVPVMTLGLGFAFMGLYAVSCSLVGVMFFLLLLGFLGGVYQVPLHAYIQYASPEHKRGQILAANNFLDFVGVLIAAAVVRILGSGLSLPPETSFLYMGILIFCLGLWILWIWKELVYRLVLSAVLTKQLGSYLKLPKSLIPVCYLVPTHSYREVRRVLAMLPKTVRTTVVILDQKLQPGWTTRLISYCVPTVICDLHETSDRSMKEAWAVLQAKRLHMLLKKQPDLCVICLGKEENIEIFSKVVLEQGISMRTIHLVSKKASYRRNRYSLSLNQADET